MQVLPFIALLATALAGESFHALIIRSLSQYHLTSFDTFGDNIIAASGGDLKLILNTDTTLIDPESQKYLNINDDQTVTLKDTPQSGYSFKDGYLAFEDSSAFKVCADYRIKFNSNDDNSCTGVAVSVRNQEKVDDLHRPEFSETDDKEDGSENNDNEFNPGPDFDDCKSETDDKCTSETDDNECTPEADDNECTPEADDNECTPEADDNDYKPENDDNENKPETDDNKDDTEQFGLIAIHSGSSVQNAAIKKVPEHPHVFSVGGSEGEDLKLTLYKESQTLADQDHRGINLDDKTGELGNVAPFGRQPPTSGFTIDGGHLSYNGNSNWNACPSGEDKYSLSIKECTGGISIDLHVVNL